MKYIAPISIFVFLTIVSLLYYLRRRKSKHSKFNYAEEGKNIAKGMMECKKLHKKLVTQIHPDRMPIDLQEEANQLTQLINESRYDYKNLIQLSEKVDSLLTRVIQPKE